MKEITSYISDADTGQETYREAFRFEWLFQLSGALLLIAGILTAIFTLRYIVASYSPTPFSDGWAVLASLSEDTRWFSLKWLWSQHSEHRIALFRLSLIADLKLFGGRSVLLFILIVAIVSGHWMLWAVFFKQILRFPRYIWLALAGWFAFCVFCPIQHENFSWGFQWGFLAAFTFASASFVSLVLFAEKGRPALAVSASCAAAFLSECCLANGIAVWPIILLGSLFLPLTRRLRSVMLAIASVSVAVYMIGYHTPVYHSDPAKTIRQPGRVLHYLVIYFGHCLENYTSYPSVCAVILTTVAGAALFILLKDKMTRPAGLALFMAMLFTIGTGAMTVLGRMKFGIFELTAGRYQTCVMLYWACAFAAILLASWIRHSRRDIITAMWLALLLIALPYADLSPLLQATVIRSNTLAVVGTSFDQGVQDPALQTVGNLGGPLLPYAEPATLKLHQRGLLAGPVPVSVPKDILNTHFRSAEACLGYFDSLTPVERFYPGPREYRARGWALDMKSKSPVKLVVIGDDNGNVLSSTQFHQPRYDVVSTMKVSDEMNGWLMYVPVPPSVKELHAYAIIQNRACEVATMDVPPI